MPSGPRSARAGAFVLLAVVSYVPWLLPVVFPGPVAPYAAVLGVAVFAVTAAWFTRRVLAPRGRRLGVRDPSWHVRLLAGLAVGALVYAAVFGARTATGAATVSGVAAGRAVLVAVLLGLAVAGYQAVSEEVVFRGALIGSLPARWGPVTLVGVSVGSFVLYHLPKWPALLHGPYAVHLVLAGTAFAVAYLRTGSLWLGIGLHGGWNLAAHVLLEAERPLVLLAAPLVSGWRETSSWLAVGGNAVLLLAALSWPVRRRVGEPHALSAACTVISDPGDRVRVQFPSG